MIQNSKDYDWSLPIAWLLLSFASMYIAGFLNFYLFLEIDWLFTICIFAAAQTLILFNLIVRPWRWLVVSVFSGVIVIILMTGLSFLSLPYSFYPLMTGMLFGLVIGILQSLILSSKLLTRIIWTLASVLGWTLPYAYLSAAESGLLGPGVEEWVSMGLYDTPLVSVIIKSAVGLSVGFVTGIALAYLLYQSWKANKVDETSQPSQNV